MIVSWWLLLSLLLKILFNSLIKSANKIGKQNWCYRAKTLKQSVLKHTNKIRTKNQDHGVIPGLSGSENFNC